MFIRLWFKVPTQSTFTLLYQKYEVGKNVKDMFCEGNLSSWVVVSYRQLQNKTVLVGRKLLSDLGNREKRGIQRDEA